MPAKNKDAVEMMCSIGELAGLFEKSGSLDDFLQTAVSIIAWHMRAAVCSIYLQEPDQKHLILAATQGLSAGSVGRVRLRLGEGLVGKAVLESRVIRVARAAEHPDFKPIEGIGEERFEGFLVVPIHRGATRIGALVVQDPQPDYFNDRDSRALKAISTQLASVIENARLLIEAHEKQEEKESGPVVFPKLIKGISLSRGIVRGRALPLGLDAGRWIRRMAGETQPRGKDDFERALKQTEEQLEALQKELARQAADIASLIFSAHLLILKDRSFTEPIRSALADGQSAQRAILNVFESYETLLRRNRNPRIREKVNDLEDLAHRLMGNLLELSAEETTCENRILIARSITPSELIRLAAQHASGAILLEGGESAHVAILARSMNFPALVIPLETLLGLDEDAMILLDADQGNLFIRPGPEILQEYDRLEIDQRNLSQDPETGFAPSTTRDGTPIRILATMNLLSDLPLISRCGAEGIGLYRSEFPYLVRDDFPSEEEQTRIYRLIVEKMEGRPVTFRTLDIGGDKLPDYFSGPAEANPALGLRAIRFSLRHRGVFSQQVRALLRAAWDSDLRILFPMISSVDEFRAARRIVEECQEELRRERIPGNETPQIGIMVESPAAVEEMDVLAAESDFLSVGSNDLIQHLLVVDRTNAAVAEFYQPYHPAVLRVLARISEAAQRIGRDLNLCGEMAGEPRMLPFLIGIGFRAFTVDAARVRAVRRQISQIDVQQAVRLAQEALSCVTVADARRTLGIPGEPISG